MTLVNRFEAAELLGMSDAAVYDRSRKDPDFPKPKINGKAGGDKRRRMSLWDKDDIIAWGEANPPHVRKQTQMRRIQQTRNRKAGSAYEAAKQAGIDRFVGECRSFVSGAYATEWERYAACVTREVAKNRGYASRTVHVHGSIR